MTASDVADWMLLKLKKEDCVYQDDVVDYLVKNGQESHLKENADGNQVLTVPILNAFRKLTETNVVWVRPGLYWRFRVPEDEEGREARG